MPDHVPYRSAGAAITDLIGGQVQVLFIPSPAVIEHVKGGRLRALAVTSAGRWEEMADLPTVSDFSGAIIFTGLALAFLSTASSISIRTAKAETASPPRNSS